MHARTHTMHWYYNENSKGTAKSICWVEVNNRILNTIVNYLAYSLANTIIACLHTCTHKAYFDSCFNYIYTIHMTKLRVLCHRIYILVIFYFFFNIHHFKIFQCLIFSIPFKINEKNKTIIMEEIFWHAQCKENK